MNIHENQAKALLSEFGVAISKGVERVVEIELAGKDREAFDKSVGAVQGLVDACKKIAPDLLGR